MIDDDRFGLAADASERATLTTFLDFQREALRQTCAGLTDQQLRQRAVPTSTLTLIGLMRHLAGVERWYFQNIIAGASPGSLYPALGDDFHQIDAATGPEALAQWQAEITASRQITARLPLNHQGKHPETGQALSLRWVLTHMIDEYARHNGHADLIREAIDGVTGEVKPAI